MKFSEMYRGYRPIISIELSPPRTDRDVDQLNRGLPDWAALPCPMVHVAYGTRPEGRAFALDLTGRLKRDYGKEVCNHLTCLGSGPAEIDLVLTQMQKRGIDNTVALRGNPPIGQTTFAASPGGYEYADQLVRHIRGFGGFGIGVGGHPEKHFEAPNVETDLANLKRKVDSGADVIFTQFFYENRHFYRFVTGCRAIGIDVPIVPSLLPIVDFEAARSVAAKYHVSIPAALLDQLTEADGDRDRIQDIGTAHAVNQARDLLAHGVPGIHFHVLNQYLHISQILKELARNSVSLPIRDPF